MGLLEEGVEIYNTLFKFSIVFFTFFFLANSIYNFVEIPMPIQLDWGVKALNDAINSLQNAKGLDIATAIPFLLVSAFALLITAFINGILFVKWLIDITLQYLILSHIMDVNTSIFIANILSWIIIFPAVMGLIVDIGRIIFYAFTRLVSR